MTIVYHNFSGGYSICLGLKEYPFLSAAISEQVLVVSNGAYISRNDGNPRAVSLSSITPIVLSVQNLPSMWDQTLLPVASVGGKSLHVDKIIYDSDKNEATILVQIPPNPLQLQGSAEGEIVFFYGLQNTSIMFEIFYVDDRFPYVASILQPYCNELLCTALEVQNHGEELIALQIAGILTRFSTISAGIQNIYVFQCKIANFLY